MPYLSIEFAVFFLVFFPLYWLFRRHVRIQNGLILLSSAGWLYALNPLFMYVVMGYGFFVWLIGRLTLSCTQKKPGGACAKIALWIGILGTLGLLAFFKYNAFFVPLLRSYLDNDQLDILLPLGISYYCFQGIAYLYAIYREKPGMPLLETLAFLSFFATVTTGPIARTDSMAYPRDTVSPLRQKTLVDDGRKLHFPGAVRQWLEAREMITPHVALSYLLLGMFKVWVLSSFFATHWVDPIFDNPDQYSALTVLLGIYGYTLELYCNFSGSIDMIIGFGMLLGFNLPPNFAMPLRAVNLRDFWQRWHITLSLWIRDHIYIPLGGNRKGMVRTLINLMIAMVLSGIWHGAGYTFAIWGALHGLGLVWLHLVDQYGWILHKINRFGKALSILINVHFVALTFVVFHASSMSEAGMVFQALFHGPLGADWQTLLAIGILGVLLWVYPLLDKGFTCAVNTLERTPILFWPLLLALVFSLIVLMAPPGIPSFIYANF